MTPEQKKIQELEAKLEQMQREMKKAQTRADNLQSQVLTLQVTSRAFLEAIVESLVILQSKYPTDTLFQKELWEKITAGIDKAALDLSKEKFFKRLFKKGSERLKYPEMTESLKIGLERVNALKPRQRSVDKRAEQLGEALSVAGKAVCLVAQQSGDDALQSAAALAGYPDPVPEQPAAKDSVGRQSLPFEPNEDEATEPELQCSCGHSDFVFGAVSQSALRTTQELLHDVVSTVGSRYQQARCEHCGRVHLVYLDGDVPVTPTSTMGQSSAIAAAVMNANGIPLHKVQKILFGKDAKLGNETLGRNIHHLCQDTFKPMQGALVETMNKQHALLADETTIKVLQSQGKGSCEPAEHTRQTDYLAAVCSASYESKRCVVFSHLGGRGNEAIHENLTAYRPEVLVTDAYAAYDSYCEKAGIKHQCCLVHLKRELLDAVDIDSLVKAFKCRTPEQAIERAVKEINNDESIYYICCVIKGISKIYGYERMIKRQDYGSDDEYFEAVLKNRRRHAKALMDSIDAVMLALSGRYAKVQGGKYVKGSRNDQLSKAVTYYMNHRENFRLFLDDGKIPLDTNAVESSIRAVAVLRKACDHKQSVEYTESLCTLMSLTETAKVNGIDNVIEWLTEYSKAYYLHRASNTLTYEVNENRRSMDSKLMAFNEGSEEGFDMEPWLPWNYKARSST